MNKSVNMKSMLVRKEIDLDPTTIKLKKNGYEPITGRFSLVDYSSTIDQIKIKQLGNFGRMDKG